MTTPHDVRTINKLMEENKKLRLENSKLKAAGNVEKLAAFEKQKQQAVEFAIRGIEEITMRTVLGKMPLPFGIPATHPIFRAFRDCLRLAAISLDPRKITALYQALAEKNPNADGSIPTYEQLQEVLAKVREEASNTQNDAV